MEFQKNSILIGFKFNFLNEILSNFLNRTALHIAVEKGNLEVVQLLLERKEIDVNIKEIFLLIFI